MPLDYRANQTDKHCQSTSRAHCMYFLFQVYAHRYKNRIIFGTPCACTISCGFKSEAKSGKHRDVIVVMYFFFNGQLSRRQEV